MKATYDLQIFSVNHKPKERRNCIIVYGEYKNENTNVMFATYNKEKDLFQNGLGVEVEGKYVQYWAYEDTCVVVDNSKKEDAICTSGIKWKSKY